MAARTAREVGHRPPDGAYVDGLVLEGCRWDPRIAALNEALPRQLHSHLPVVWLCPVVVDTHTHEQRGVYEAPVYRTSARHGKLSTTGHSSNFVMMAPLPTQLPAAHWVQRGVALICSLDDDRS